MFKALLCTLLLVAQPAAAWSPRGEAPVAVGDHTNYTPANSSFMAYAGDWCRNFPGFNLIQGVDYADSIASHTSSFPGNTKIDTRWPNLAPYQWIGSLGVPLTCGVWGMMAVSYGNYAESFPTVAITPRQVSGITTLTEEINLTIGGDVADFSVLDEFYLTTTAGNTTYANQEVEIGTFLHAGVETLAFVKSITQCGTYTDPQGRAWRCAYSDKFHTFTLLNDADVLVGTFDRRAQIQYLVGIGRVNTSWWFNGMGVGIEPTKNSGTMTLNRWTVVYN